MNKRLDKYNFFIYTVYIVTGMFSLIYILHKLNHKHYAEVNIYKRR